MKKRFGGLYTSRQWDSEPEDPHPSEGLGKPQLTPHPLLDSSFPRLGAPPVDPIAVHWWRLQDEIDALMDEWIEDLGRELGR